jgi:hypothetical protein
MDPTACNDWQRNLINTAIICANFDGIPVILHVIPAQAGISARHRDDKLPADAGMTV